MKTILLLRHAKSSWADPEIEDHDRPLNARGMAACPVIGAWLRDHGYGPDVVLCSSSRRTRQTVEELRKTVPDLPGPDIDPDLYHAMPDAMLARLNALPDSAGTVLLVGHQPGLGSLLRLLSDGQEKRRCRRAFEHFPTASVAVLRADIDHWSDLGYGRAQFVDFAKPRELQDA